MSCHTCSSPAEGETCGRRLCVLTFSYVARTRLENGTHRMADTRRIGRVLRMLRWRARERNDLGYCNGSVVAGPWKGKACGGAVTLIQSGKGWCGGHVDHRYPAEPAPRRRRRG